MTECNTVNISRGSDWLVTLEFKDEEDMPIDYTGATLSADMVSNADDSIILSPIAVWDDAGQGQASLSLDETQTLSVPAGAISRLRIMTVTTGGTTKIWPTALVDAQ